MVAVAAEVVAQTPPLIQRIGRAAADSSTDGSASRLDRRRVYLYAGGLRKGRLISAILFPPPPNVYDQSEQHGEDNRLQDKLLSVNVARPDEERSVGVSCKPEKTAFAVRRKHQRQDAGKKKRLK